MYKFSLAILFFVYLLLSSYANSDLLLGRSFLFMDEQVSFDGVNRILNFRDWNDFYFQVTDGGDHRYGRIFWNVSALISWIPSILFGDPGQIFATRLACAVLQAAAFLILTETFVKKKFEKIFCLAMLLFLPFSDYYATMPKPEPLQLFLLSLFFHYGFKSRFRNPYIWIIWGMSFGAKISTLVTLPVCGILFLHSNYRKIMEPENILKMLSIPFFIVLGLCISVPILFNLNYEVWINFTFLNTTQGDDSEAINIFTWFKYSEETFWSAPRIIISAMYIFYFISFCHYIFAFSVKTLDSRKKMVVFLLSALFFLSIALSVKRIWGMYLHFFSVFFIISVFQNIEFIPQAFKISQFLSNCKFLLVMLLMSVLLAVRINSSYLQYENLHIRTVSENFKMNYRRFTAVKDFLKAKYLEKGRLIYVAMDPFLFDQELNPSIYNIEKFWGPFLGWERKYDYIIIGEYFLILPKEKNVNYYGIQKSILELDRHLFLEGKKGCAKKPCYRELKRIEGLRIFSLADGE